MRSRLVHTVLGVAAVCGMYVAAGITTGAQAPLAVDSARITISGTSNIHAYTASTSTIRLTRGQLAGPLAGPDLWTNALKPGGVEAFEVSIPAATLTSPREGLDKNMHKALQVAEHPAITFRLVRLEAGAKPNALKAVGVLQIAGVEREITLDVTTEHTGATLGVKGQITMLMTDFGIKPPVAMLGMLKTDPKVTVTFETVLTVPLT